MTEQEQRSLKCYLTNVLEPMLKSSVSEFDKENVIAENTALHSLDRDIASKMRNYHRGRRDALASAITNFKELFESELQTVEEE
jgi:hypothetical protein